MRSIYFDYAAATPMREEVMAAMQPFLAEQFYNPSAEYLRAKGVRRALEEARSSVAKSLGVRASEIVFVAGGTEANNLAIDGVMNQFPEATMIALETEHDSVLEPAKKHRLKLAAVLKDGRIDEEKLKQYIDDTTALVSIGLVNSEIGTVQSLQTIGAYIENVRKQRRAGGNQLPLYFHTDACQAGNYISLQVSKLGVDLMTINGGKLYGPKQSGALYVRAGIVLQPLVRGGGQEFGRRSGTENVAGSIGFAKALELAQAQRQQASKDMHALQQYFIAQIMRHLPDARINGSQKHRIANNVHVTFPGQDNERLMMGLDESGIMCAVGSACSASKDEPSHVLSAIGLAEADARASLRFTMGSFTEKSDIDHTVATLKRLLA